MGEREHFRKPLENGLLNGNPPLDQPGFPRRSSTFFHFMNRENWLAVVPGRRDVAGHKTEST
jgi:hypothetical protein